METSALHPRFAAEVTGMTLHGSLASEERIALERALDRYAVLVFRDQRLSEEQQMALTRSLGPIDMGLLKVLTKHTSSNHPGLIAISNVDASGALIDREDNRLMALYANQLWHSDSSFKAPSAKYSLLLALTLPAAGGETEFADMRAAYDDLTEERRAALEGVVAEHSAFYSRMQLGDAQYTQADLDAYPTVRWPVVRKNASSGRKSLFIGAHAMRVVGQPIPEGRLMLGDLLEHATQREYVYRHVWSEGDLVIWDNRSVLHRGRPYDLAKKRRLRRSTVEDAALA